MPNMPMWGDPATTGAKYRPANDRSAKKLKQSGITDAGRRRRNIKGPYRGRALRTQIDRTSGF